MKVEIYQGNDLRVTGTGILFALKVANELAKENKGRVKIVLVENGKVTYVG